MKLIKYILIFTIFISTLVAKDLKKVSLQLQWKHQFEFAGFYIAKEKGFYKDVGLDMEIKEFNFGTNTIKDVENEITTFGISYPTIILEKSKGADVVLLGSILQSSPHILVSLKSSGIKSIKDFKNKKIMINDNASKTASFISMLKSQDILLDDMVKVKHSFNIEDLINKKVDIITAFSSNELYTLEKKGIEYDVWDPKDYGFDFYDVITFTLNKTLIENPSMVKAFKKASLKGWTYAFENIDETIELILEKYNTQNKTKEALLYEAKVLKQLAYHNVDRIGKIDKNKIQRIYDIYNLMGLAKNKINIDKFIFQNIQKQLTLTAIEKDYLLNNKVIRMCNNPNIAPFEFTQNGNMNNMQGIAIDTIKLIEKKLNISFKNIPTTSWTQSQQFLKDKKCDILPFAVKNKQRTSYANFTKPYISLPLAIFTQKNQPIISGIDEINNKKISVKKGSSIIPMLKSKYPNLIIKETNSVESALRDVNNGNTYFTISNVPTVSYCISKNIFNNLQISGYLNIIAKASIAIRNDNIILLKILDKALYNISEESHKKIYKKWVSSSIQEPITDYSLVWQILSMVFIIILFFIYQQYMLKKSIKESQELINATMEAIVIHKNGICIDVNQSAIDMFGFKVKDDFKGLNILQQVAQESQELVKKKMSMENTNQYEATLLRKDGSKFYGLVHGKFIHNKTLRLAGIIDITLLKEQEQLISEQSKMVQMGEMIGNIAHQWRQPLSVISTAASGIKVQKKFDLITPSQENEMLDNIVKNANFLSDTIDIFRDYIKEEKEIKEVILQTRISGAINIIEATIKNNHIKLITNIDDTEPIPITMVVGELSQVIINLINNAKDILLEKKINEPFIKISLIKKNNTTIIEVEDNGGGIPNDILAKIFNPYFTTKHQSQGTGLGLHMSKNIIEQHLNGKLSAKNYKYGAIFTIELPLV